MTPSTRVPVRRGRRGPSAVWIARMRRKDGLAYRIRWVDPFTGKVESQACGKDLALARSQRDAKKAELRDGLSGRLPDKSLTNLIDAIAGFMAGRSWHTVRKTKDSLESVKELCGDRLLQHVGKDTVMDFRSRRLATGVAVATVNLEKGAIHVVNVPEAGDFTKSRKNWTIPTHPIVRRELVAMRADVSMMVQNGRAVPKHPHVFSWPDGLPYKPDWITHRFAAVAKAAGVSASIQDLRRSFSTLAQRAGVDRMTVKELGGWSSVAVVERHYTGEIKPVLERAMDQIARAQGVA